MEADVRKPYCPPDAQGGSAATASAEQPSSAQPQPDKGPGPPHFEGFQRLSQLVSEYKEYASYYLATKLDGMKASLRSAGIYAGLGIVGLIAFSALISTAVALFLVGAAMGLAHLFDPPKYWLGALSVGLGVLVLVGIGAAVGVSKANAGFRKATVEKYEQRKRWQRGQFGRDVEQAAAADEKAK
jgi:hypothetical protein